jgi:polyisoprenoid-binding protein YceI
MVEGNLTIKGVSKFISFPFTATATANGYVLAGQFKINRRDFNVGGSSWVLSDELSVSLNVAAIK